MRRFKIDGKGSSIRNDCASDAKRQVKLKAEVENILVDIHPDPAISHKNEEKEIDFDDTLCHLHLDSEYPDIESTEFEHRVVGSATFSDIDDDLAL